MKFGRLSNHISSSFAKLTIGFLVGVVAITSINVQAASAQSLLPQTPTFKTAAQALYDAAQQQNFVLPRAQVHAAQMHEEEIETPPPVVKYSRTVTVTAYNSVPWQTDSTPCISADGSNICELLEQGDISCASHLPFGTKINIPGIGVCTVRDRLHPRFAYRIDIYFGGAEKIQAAKQWGKRRLTVDVLEN